MKSAVIVFPGSNCDRDAYSVLDSFSHGKARGQQAEPAPRQWRAGKSEMAGRWPDSGASCEIQENFTEASVKLIWHGDSVLPKVDLVIVPGGFSYGDYLRSGAMAAHSPIMREVVAHANRGGLVLGICNGFQILTEAGLLPGTLLRNAGLKFLCREVFLRVENTATSFTSGYQKGQVINVPIAHHDGNYYADDNTLKSLEDHTQIAFRYCDAKGALSEAANPNGSRLHIAGLFNQNKNVLGMMPHPERHAEALTGGTDGRAMFEGLMKSAA